MTGTLWPDPRDERAPDVDDEQQTMSQSSTEPTHRLRRVEIISLVGAVVLAAVLLVWGSHMGRARAGTVGRFWSGGGSLLVWRSHGELVARFTAATGSPVERRLGDGVAARLVAGGHRPLLLVTDVHGGHRLLDYDGTSARWRTILASPQPHDLTNAVMARGLVYVARSSAHGPTVVAIRRDGRTAATYRLPKLPPDPTALLALPSRPGTGTGGASAGVGRARVDALVAAGGRVLAVTSTRAAAGLTDLSSGRTVTFDGYVDVRAATTGGDGMVYVLAASNDPAFSQRVLRIDPRSLRIVFTFDTGVAGHGRPASALPSRFGAVFYSPGTPGSIDALSGTDLWLVDGGGLNENSTVTSDDGALMGPGPGDSVLLFGSPAGAAVTSVGLSDGAVRRADAHLTAPSGTVVVLAAE